MKKLAVVSIVALMAACAFCAGAKKFGKMNDNEWVVTNAWQAMQHRVMPNSEWATNHFDSTEFSNAVNRAVVQVEGWTTNAIKDIVRSSTVTNAGAVAAAKTYTDQAISEIPQGTDTNAVQSIIQRNIDTNLLCTVETAQAMTNGVMTEANGKFLPSEHQLTQIPPKAFVRWTNDCLCIGTKYNGFENDLFSIEPNVGSISCNYGIAGFDWIKNSTQDASQTLQQALNAKANSSDVYTKSATDSHITSATNAAMQQASAKFLSMSTDPGMLEAGFGIYWEQDGLVLKANPVNCVDFGDASKVYFGNTHLPLYLADGDWNTADDPFAKVSQIPQNYVPNTRTVNNKPLTSNITLSASDVGAPTTANAILVGQNAANKSFSIGNTFGSTMINSAGITINGGNRLGATGGGASVSADGFLINPMTFVSTNEYQNGIRTIYGPGYLQIGSSSITSHYLIIPDKDGTLATTDDITQLPNNAVVLTNGQVKTVSGTALSAHDIGAPTTNELENTKAIVYTWENFLDGSNVVFSITNYISGSYNLNTAKFRILEMTNGVYREVYNSREEIVMHLDDFKTNDFRVATNQVITSVDAKIAGKADKAWGRYTSAGGEAPSNTVYLTEPNTVFAGGLEYERVAVGEGSICVLTTKGAPVYTVGDEGTFKFQDDGGTNFFGFAKTDSYVIGADASGISVQNHIVTINYDVTMSGVPCIWYKADLTSNVEWEQLNLPDGTPVAGASHVVSWEATPPAGKEICYINCPEAKGFFKATIEVAGSAKFMTNMPADLSGGIFCTDGQHKVKINWNNGAPTLVPAN